MDKIKTFWLKLPLWLRSSTLEALEMIAVTVLTYLLSVATHQTNFDFSMIVAIILKTLLKVIRVNPSIPVPDYVNPPQS